MYTRNPQGSWECHTRGNTTSLDCNEQQQKDKESFLIPKTLQGGNRLILLLSSIHMITFYKKKKKVTQEVEPQDKRVEPQVQTAELECEPTVPRAWNLITFAWLGFEIVWDQWLSFCFLLSLFDTRCLSLLSYASPTTAFLEQLVF